MGRGGSRNPAPKLHEIIADSVNNTAIRTFEIITPFVEHKQVNLTVPRDRLIPLSESSEVSPEEPEKALTIITEIVERGIKELVGVKERGPNPLEVFFWLCAYCLGCTCCTASHGRRSGWDLGVNCERHDISYQIHNARLHQLSSEEPCSLILWIYAVLFLTITL